MPPAALNPLRAAGASPARLGGADALTGAPAWARSAGWDGMVPELVLTPRRSAQALALERLSSLAAVRPAASYCRIGRRWSVLQGGIYLQNRCQPDNFLF